MRILMMNSWIHRFLTFFCVVMLCRSVYALDANDEQKFNILLTDFSLLGRHTKENTAFFQTILTSMRKDLEISGLFDFVDDNENVSTAQKVRNHNIDIVLTGFVEFTPEENQISLVLRAFDTVMEKLVIKKVIHSNYKQYKRLGHVIADEVYKYFVGGVDLFNSHLLFLERKNVKNKLYKRLALMDINGENKKYLSPFLKNINNPAVSANNKYLSYVKIASDGNAKIVVKNLTNKLEYLVGGGSYNASSPARFSPDGNEITYSLSQGPYTNIYTYNWLLGINKRLTGKIKGINTSPSYNPSGQQIAFSSDTSGEAALYRIHLETGKISKITKGGVYTNPVWSPTGEYIVFTKMIKEQFYLGVIRVDGTGERLIAKDFVLESPSWSNNGRYVVFSRQTKEEGSEIMKSQLYMIDVLSLNEVKIEDDASSPYWAATRKA